MDTALSSESSEALGLSPSTVESIRARVHDSVTESAARRRETELESSRAKLAAETEETRLTVAVLCGEDLPMGFVNLWLMVTFDTQTSTMLLVSFALNCVMLGFKLTKVLELAKLGARRVKEAWNHWSERPVNCMRHCVESTFASGPCEADELAEAVEAGLGCGQTCARCELGWKGCLVP